MKKSEKHNLLSAIYLLVGLFALSAADYAMFGWIGLMVWMGAWMFIFSFVEYECGEDSKKEEDKK